ncbi:hypothetical protein WOLCODRAFT_135329 [Wolfiporia cocos MD-104 SS10]|uniref:Sphingolipid long chain base-responsive protein LSP1 n=1 Tax=Wolfiporia cocos (strain MD-104) TaxID=742152 RepID=A0A2H3J4X9_WOLCO|nr:hypothetical protein WOLCODRAFT_135329 [Wolfiporia cocos MD-104 SS10]
MSDFLSQITGRAQNALKQAGLTGQPGDSENARGGILKSHAVESIHHQLRSFQQQYSNSVAPVQKIITTEKGVALDFDSLASDSHAHSKELYMWGQREEPDIKDVTDRLAWINYIEGSLAQTLAQKLDASRAPFKALRDAENNLSGRRNIRASLHNQIARVEHDQQRGSQQRLAELRQQLHQAEVNDEPQEKEIELLKRKAIRDSENLKWQASREYAEKLLLLSQASSAVLKALPTIPPGDHQYHGAETTASVRAALQQALDNYKLGDIVLPLQTPVELARSDTRSFGETHAQELSRINTAGTSVQPNIPLTPPPTVGGSALPPAQSQGSNSSYASPPPSNSPPLLPTRGSPTQMASSPPVGTQSPPLNPMALNQAPAPIPVTTSSSSPVVAPNPTDPAVKIPSITPTVAETGVPKSAGSDGPGPASGSIHDLKQPSPVATKDTVAGQDTEGPYGTGSLPRYVGPSGESSSGAEKPEKYESAEEEKKRLEREERERLLASGATTDNQQAPGDDSELPPYQEFTE